MWIPVTGNVLQASLAFKLRTAFSSDDESACAVLPQFVVCQKSSWEFLDKQTPHGSVLLPSRCLGSEN